MLKSKQIKRLEERLNDLENKVTTLILAHATNFEHTNSTIPYEEVINEWLCGKETN